MNIRNVVIPALVTLVVSIAFGFTSGTAFAEKNPVKQQIDELDERVSTIEEQNLAYRLDDVESELSDIALTTIPALSEQIDTLNYAMTRLVDELNLAIPSIVNEVNSLNEKILEHEGRLTFVEEHLQGLEDHLIGMFPGVNLATVPFDGENFVGIDLRGVNMVGATLTYTEMTGVDLRGANLATADLSGADLSCNSPYRHDCVQLDHANLGGANLSQADLGGAFLNYSNLSGTDMHLADLQDASLIGGNLKGADLAGTNFGGADLSLADLRGANVYNAYLDTAIWNDTICPDGTNSNDNDNDGFTCLTNRSSSIYGP